MLYGIPRPFVQPGQTAALVTNPFFAQKTQFQGERKKGFFASLLLTTILSQPAKHPARKPCPFWRKEWRCASPKGLVSH